MTYIVFGTLSLKQYFFLLKQLFLSSERHNYERVFLNTQYFFKFILFKSTDNDCSEIEGLSLKADALEDAAGFHADKTKIMYTMPLSHSFKITGNNNNRGRLSNVFLVNFST